MLIRSYEDYSVETFLGDVDMPFYYGGHKKQIKMVVVRDPANLFASRIKSGYTETFELEQVDLYLNHISQMNDSDEILFVNYNRFICEQAYRDELALAIGQEQTTSDPLANISQYGGGSSFSSRSLTPTELLQRYEKLASNEEFQLILKDDRIKAVFRKYFPKQYDDFVAFMDKRDGVDC
ncbi:MAG: hypothetical protein WBD31_03560 [Rubripirellula sp.]